MVVVVALQVELGQPAEPESEEGEEGKEGEEGEVGDPAKKKKRKKAGGKVGGKKKKKKVVLKKPAAGADAGADAIDAAGAAVVASADAAAAAAAIAGSMGTHTPPPGTPPRPPAQPHQHPITPSTTPSPLTRRWCMCTEDVGDAGGPPATMMCRAGHKSEWTLILKTTNKDKAQICSAGLGICENSSFTPLRLMEAVLETTKEALGDIRGPVRGSTFLDEVRTLCQATRDRILAEDSAAKVE